MKRTFYDQDTDLEWITFDSDNKEYLDIINQLNDWSSDEQITKYIFQTKLGSTLNNFSKKDPMRLFFAKTDGKLISVVALSEREHIFDEDKLKNYILRKQSNTSQEEFPIIDEKYLQFDDTFAILKNKNKTNLFIDYIITNPNFRRRGLGTAIISSIKHNLNFFSSKDVELIQANIDNENIPSRKAFLKNGFRKMRPCRKSIPFSAYYFTLLKDKIL